MSAKIILTKRLECNGMVHEKRIEVQLTEGSNLSDEDMETLWKSLRKNEGAPTEAKKE